MLGRCWLPHHAKPRIQQCLLFLRVCSGLADARGGMSASLSRPRSSPFWLRHAIFLLHVVLHWLILPHGALASLRGQRVATS